MNRSKTRLKIAVSAMLFAALTSPASFAQESTPGYNNKIPDVIMTPDTVETRIGTMRFFDGMPDDATVRKAYDNLDFMRGVEVFLNFIPATSVEGLRRGMLELGAETVNDVVIFDKLMGSDPLFLTGNTDTVYASIFLDLERDGPVVIEIPPGAGPSTVNDAYFRFVVDMGRPGPDRGEGGKYIILPPDYEGDIKPTEGSATTTVDGEAYYVAQSTSYINWAILRGLLVDGKPDVPAKVWKTGLRSYRLADKGNPPETRFISGSGKKFNTIHANTYPFYEELHHVLQKEPVDFLDPELRGLAASIGIAKGKPFKPDERLRKTLVDAVAVGNATARAIWLNPRDERAYLYENSNWYTGFIGGDYRWLNDDGLGGRNMDARTLFFYSATVNTPAMALRIPGVGSQYAFNNRDTEGNYLDGSKSYKLNIPANVPAKNFWSVVVYDPQTRSELQTDQPYPSKNNVRDKLLYNEDGSVDLYFGPETPAGKEANWTQTVPGKGWFVLLRLYGPLEPWFERTWQPGEFERLE